MLSPCLPTLLLAMAVRCIWVPRACPTVLLTGVLLETTVGSCWVHELCYSLR